MANDYITQITATNGTTYDIRDTTSGFIANKIWTGYCTTTSSTATKVVTLDDSTGFSDAVAALDTASNNTLAILVRFKYGNSAAAVKLNVNSIGAVNIIVPTGTADGASTTYSAEQTWSDHEAVLFLAHATSVIGAGNVAAWTMASATSRAASYIYNNYAASASPALTGTPTAPTASAGTNSTQIATTAFVTTAIANAASGAATFKGTVNAGTDISGLTAYSAGWYWVVATAGTYVGETCEVGDMIFCVSDYNSAYSASDFAVVQNNIVTISNAEIDSICT